MPDSLPVLLQQRDAILHEVLSLGDFRSGSITTTSGKCGKPNCRCHQAGNPGHGPTYRLTRKRGGKTVTESFFFASRATQGSVGSGSLPSIPEPQWRIVGSEREDL
jgi:hypothetical protein